MLQFFAFDHLRGDLRGVSRPFAEPAQQVVALVPAGPERTVSLRKLLRERCDGGVGRPGCGRKGDVAAGDLRFGGGRQG